MIDHVYFVLFVVARARDWLRYSKNNLKHHERAHAIRLARARGKLARARGRQFCFYMIGLDFN